MVLFDTDGPPAKLASRAQAELFFRVRFYVLGELQTDVASFSFVRGAGIYRRLVLGI